MPTSTLLSNPKVSIGAAIGSIVDLTDQTTAATLTRTVEALEDTAFGTGSRTYTGGLENNELTVTMYMSYAASETYASLSALVGTKCTVKVNPAYGSGDSATNPGFILTDTYLESLPVVNSSLGELNTVDLTFTGGVYSVDVTAP
jgi:hypothetical protein